MLSCTISSEEKIEGNWKLNLETSYYGVSEQDYGTMDFYEDGTGYITIIDDNISLISTTTTSFFTWDYDANDQLVIIENGEIMYLENLINTYNQQKFLHTTYSDGMKITMTFTLTK